MKQLEMNELRNKIKGCYTGKNIGGTFGAPFECKRQVNTVSFYTQDLSMGPPANDDLDLQLVWLNAVEKFGRTVDSHIFGEYWLSYIIPNWVEYGMAKANLRTSLLPPLSGYIDNTYGNSCGAFIRSEIWACNIEEGVYDRLDLNVTFKVTAPTSKDAIKKVTEQCEEFLAIVAELGVKTECVRAGEFSIDKNYYRERDEMTASKEVIIRTGMSVPLMNRIMGIISDKD